MEWHKASIDPGEEVGLGKWAGKSLGHSDGLLIRQLAVDLAMRMKDERGLCYDGGEDNFSWRLWNACFMANSSRTGGLIFFCKLTRLIPSVLNRERYHEESTVRLEIEW